MRTVLLSLLLLVSACSSDTRVADVTPQQVGPSTYVIYGPTETPNPHNRGFMNNPAFIITAAGVIVVDPGGTLQTGEMVLRQIRKLTDKPVTHVFNTHVHGDHWLGNQAIVAAYPQVVIYAHPTMIEEARAGAGEQWVSLMDRMTDGASKGTRPVPPNTAVGDQQTLSLNGKTFRILAPAHAHSNTDIMIHFVDEGVLFCGDNVSNQRIISLDDASFRGNIAATEQAITLQAHYYVPGHGLGGGVAVAQAYHHYLQTVYDGVAEMTVEGLDTAAMKAALLPQLSAYRAWFGFEAQLGRHISLAQGEAEGELFQ